MKKSGIHLNKIKQLLSENKFIPNNDTLSVDLKRTTELIISELSHFFYEIKDEGYSKFSINQINSEIEEFSNSLSKEYYYHALAFISTRKIETENETLNYDDSISQFTVNIQEKFNLLNIKYTQLGKDTIR